MEVNIYNKILSVFFEDPDKGYLIREISRKANVNHTSVREYLNYFVKQSILVKEKEDIYPKYHVVLGRAYLNAKLFYNLEKLRKSNLISDLNKFYDFPEVILFGSYAQATDGLNSDIDICIITDIKKDFKTEKYEKFLNRKISLHIFSKEKIKIMKEKNKELLNNIINGITVNGNLEVL